MKNADNTGNAERITAYTIKSVILAFTVFAILRVCGEIPIGYMSAGTDVYSDGGAVRDGEVYALVWSPDGKDFSGFLRDGSLADGSDSVVYAQPLAKNGRCGPVNFIIPDDFEKSHIGGKYSVIALDTRRLDGELTGLANGKPVRVNGWCFAYEQPDPTKAKAFSFSAVKPGGVEINVLTGLPDDIPMPVVTAFSVDNAGNAVVDFTNAVEYLSYQLEYGKSPADVAEYISYDMQDGKSSETNFLVLTKTEIGENRSIFTRICGIKYSVADMEFTRLVEIKTDREAAEKPMGNVRPTVSARKMMH